MVMTEIRKRITEHKLVEYKKKHALQHDIIIWELNESTLEVKFHRIVTICKDLMSKT